MKRKLSQRDETEKVQGVFCLAVQFLRFVPPYIKDVPQNNIDIPRKQKRRQGTWLLPYPCLLFFATLAFLLECLLFFSAIFLLFFGCRQDSLTSATTFFSIGFVSLDACADNLEAIADTCGEKIESREYPQRIPLAPHGK